MTDDPGILRAPGTGIASGAPSFTVANRLFRALWVLAWLLLAAWTPAPLRSWRRLVLATFGAKLHRTAVLHGSARVWYPPNLRMGAGAVLGPRVTCYCVASITLDDGAIVSQGAHLCAGSHDVDAPDFQLVARPIIIGKRAWIAAEAFVGPGVIVGEGAVLGARAVAFSDLEPYTVYVGNPARRHRARGR